MAWLAPSMATLLAGGKLFFGNTNGFKILNTELNNLNFYDLINQYVVTKVDFLKILNEFKGYFSKESEVEIGKSFGVSFLMLAV